MGVTMSLRRRLELLDWAARARAWIIEDDYSSEYRYAGRPLAALQGLDRDQRVIYLGTFSKVMFPALRLAYLIVPTDLIAPFLVIRFFASRHPPAWNRQRWRDSSQRAISRVTSVACDRSMRDARKCSSRKLSVTCLA